MSLSVNQMSYSGYTFGPGQSVQYSLLRGLRGIPPIRLSDQNRQFADGAYPGWSFMGQRVVTMTLDIVPVGASDLETVYAAMAAQFVPTDNPANLQQLEFLLSSDWGGVISGDSVGTRYVTGRVTKAEPLYDVGASVGAGYSPFDVEITCDDPLAYNLYQSNNPLSTSTFSTFGGDKISNTLACVNAGNWKSFPVITVAEVGTGTIYVNSDAVMSWTGDMGMTSPWVFDCQNRTVTDTSGDSQLGALNSGYSWPTIGAAGTTNIAVAGSVGGSPSVQVAFASAWSFV